MTGSAAPLPPPDDHRENGGAQVPILRNRVIAMLDPALAGALSYPPPLDRVFYARTLVEILHQIKGETRPIVMIEGEVLSEDDYEFVSRIRDLPGSPVLVLMGLPGSLGRAVAAARRLECNFVLPADSMHHPDDLSRWIEWIDRGGPDFGLASHLDRDAEITTLPVLSRDARPSVIHEALDFVTSAGGDGSLAYDVRLIVEEAVNNAFYHGFVDEDGKEKYRPENFSSLGADEEVTVSFGADEDTIAVAVSDTGGRLKRDELLSRLERHTGARGIYDPSGRGLYLMYSLAERMLVSVAPGRRTEIVVLFRRATPLDRQPCIKPILYFSRPTSFGD